MAQDTQKTSLARFRDDESGAGMMWNFFWCVCFLLIAGLAIDMSNAYRMRMVLQLTADSAALAAIQANKSKSDYIQLTGDTSDRTKEERGRLAAIQIAEAMMNPTDHGTVLAASDIKFGTYTKAGGFVEGSGDFAMVTTRRTSATNNPVGTYFLKLMGVLQDWDVGATAVAEKYQAACATDGVITSDKIDFQSNNIYSNKICLHGALGIEVNQNNTYEGGVIVSMEDLDTLTVPEDDLSQNIGLEDALREGYMEPHLANNVENIIASLERAATVGSYDLEYLPAAVKAAAADGTLTVVSTTKRKFDPTTMRPGNIYNITCTGGSGNNTLTLRGVTGADSTTSYLDGVVVITDCNVSFDQNTIIRNAMIATTSTDDKSMQGSAGVSVGAPDNCTPGGGAQLLTAGGMNFAAQMQFHGSQLVAAGPVNISAQVDGASGTTIQSRSRVDLASNNELGLCDGVVDPVIPVRYYRLVK